MSLTTSAAIRTAWRCPMIGFSAHNGEVLFSYRDRKNEDRKKSMALEAHEFIRRFLLHVIPKGFVRVRHFGFLANRSKGLLAKCRQLLDLGPYSAQIHKIRLRADASTHRHRYHPMPSMPKGNSGLPCRPARPHTMGFFVMIDQRTKNRPLQTLCARAHASVRPVSLLHVLWADSLLRFATRSRPIVALKTARYSHHQWCCYVCFDQSPRYNPHRHPSLLHPPL